MAEGNDIDYPRIDLIDVQPPGKQTEVSWKAIQEGLREIFWPDINGRPAIVVLPHRLQARYICNKCMKSVTITFYTVDAIRGRITRVRHCECKYGEMHRRFIGAEQDIAVELDGSLDKDDIYDEDDTFRDSLLDEFDDMEEMEEIEDQEDEIEA
ncbi:MAG: hypothetical protein GF411_03020 [Candidatus Lokiarchaeota archaeon]|nr:hypothetical protein [Candidatus Lokiarchaeota archaeon]